MTWRKCRHKFQVQEWVQNYAKGEPPSRKVSCEVFKTVEDKVWGPTTPSTVAMGSTHVREYRFGQLGSKKEPLVVYLCEEDV